MNRLVAQFAAPGLLAGRCLLALLFVHEAWIKITNYAAVVGYSEAHGVPGVMLPAAIALELGGGLLLVFGLATRVVAFLLAGFCLITAALFHTAFDDPGQLLHFEKDLAISGGFLALCVAGAGAWSLDGWLDASRRSRQTAAHP
jgi:putative oxidoreductase